MTQPSPQEWDGSGPDPWMPQRLQRQAQVAVGERTIYDDYYARLAAWLAFAGQATMSGVVPNPDAILNLAPRWVQSMTDFVHDSIAELVGKAYVSVFGPGYRYDNRPFVVDYLARATNRLVDVPDQAYTLVVSQIAEGAMAGESIAKIRDRVRESFDVSGTPYWQNRPTVVARSETISALNAGRQGAFTEVAFDLGEPFEKMWLATMAGRSASRTRPTHREADGQRVPLEQPFIVGGFPGMFPGAPELPPQESIQCVPAETLVSCPGLRAATRRWYEGDMVKISFASGDELSITPNHPVLRADGIWTPAGLLDEGDHCVRAFSCGDLLAAPDEDGGPAQIGEVYRLAQVGSLPDRICISPPDFHGDGIDGHVDVVSVDRGLRLDGHAATDEEVEQFGLALADLARASGGSSDSPALAHFGANESGGDLLASSLLPHGGGQTVAPLGTQCRHAIEHGLTAPAYGQANSLESADDGGSAYSQRERHGLDALPRGVTTSEVVKVDRYAFRGHVYNLDTGEGWYIANSILTRNCRCTQLILRPGENIDLSNRQMSDF